MPTVMTHAVVGLAAGTVFDATRRAGTGSRRRFWIASALLPVLPDFDVLGLVVGVPFYSMWGHRGISHSLAAALVLGVIAALACRASGARMLPLSLYFAIVTASHGVLDAFTNGGPGVAFFAPFDDTRYFFPWRPVPVSPLAASFFSEWGWRVFRAELVMVWLPAVAIAAAALVSRRGRARP
jgi:inner membrane protein